MASSSTQTHASTTTVSFDQQLAATLPQLRRAALRYTRNAARADDLVHDAVVRTLRFRDSFRDGSNFAAWASTILTNTFLHGYRRGRREKEILFGATRGDVEDQLRSEEAQERALRPERALLRQALSDDVVLALANLAEDFRMVVMLCDLQNLTYREVAEVLHCPLGTVMSRLHRGRRLLAQALAGFAKDQGIGRGETTPASALAA